MDELVNRIVIIITPCVNFSVMIFSLPLRWSFRYTLLIFAAVVIFIHFPLNALLGYYITNPYLVNLMLGAAYIPFLLNLIQKPFFQKMFSYFMQMVFSGTQLSFIRNLALNLFPNGGKSHNLFLLTVLLLSYTVYLTLIYNFGKRFMQKLFVDGRTFVWGIYSLGAALSFAVLVVARLIEQPFVYYLMVFFAVWSFCVLCFAIINTHEKSRQQYEAEFARNIVSTGREHYQKMDEMYDALRILRHDYKYHLKTIGVLTKSGNTDETIKYLADIDAQLSESEIKYYCSNNVINALLSHYAERCSTLNICFEVMLCMPDALSIPDYEMCIIFGNLLENALEASQKQKSGRKIELTTKFNEMQFFIRVRNSFDNALTYNEDQYSSTKKDGGFGIRSVKAVAARYDGYLITDAEGDVFTAYVAVKRLPES